MNKEGLRKSVNRGDIQWQRHALTKMLERGISRNEVKKVLICGTCIEEYPDDYPHPSGLFLGFNEKKELLHVVAAVDIETNRCYIITAYRPDSNHFEEDKKTRK